jgi:pimeloyl-ACP methyl ester carboxylesterase
MKRPIGSWILACACALSWAAAICAEPAVGNRPYCGEYFLPSGKRVSVFEQGVVTEMARLAFTNWESGRVGPLVPDGADRFTSPSPSPESAVEVVFGRDAEGAVTDLTIREGEGEPVHARRVRTFDEAAVRFSNGEVTLAGTLKTPLTPGPHPAVVLVHGSGPGTREQMEFMARFFVHLGLTALTYDKRGCGESSGDWKTVDLEALADDALAAVAMLRARPDVDARKVGLWGISQGGWIGPLAASRSDQVAFVINHSGPGTSLRRQDTYMTANVLRAQGVPPDDIGLALDVLNTLYDYGQKKASAQALDAAVAKLRDKPMLEDFVTLSSGQVIPDSMYSHQTIGDPAWFFHLDPDRDALAPYRRLRCPLLVVYGRLDYTVPVEESAAKIDSVLRESAHPDYTVKVLERTGHGTTVMQTEDPMKPAEPPAIALEYFALLQEWLCGRGFCAAARD